MTFVVKYVKIVRNNWKKSTFAAVALTYGYVYAKEYLETQELMREYCERAAFYGNQPIPVNVDPKTITVILNPNANKRKAMKQFEKYCAPILNLAGICVDVIQTESEGHAKTLMENLSTTDAIVVAGGDGTLSEVVTGLLRRADINSENLVPIGVLPLGKSNTIASSFFPGGDHLKNIRSLGDASMAVIQEVTKPVDIMKIEVLGETDDLQKKPIYAVSGIEWGAYRDAQAKKDKYWYLGPLRNYATYLFNGYKNSLSWNCEAEVLYTPPCEGCSNCCTNSPVREKRWYHRLIPYKQTKPASTDYSKIVNDACNQTFEKRIITSDLALLTSNTIRDPHLEQPPKLRLNIGPDEVDYFDFVKQGWLSENGERRPLKETIEARQIKLVPMNSQDEKGKWFSIDNEDYEAKSIKITLLPKMIQMFCKGDDVTIVG